MRADVGRLKQRGEFLLVAKTRRKWAAPGLVLQARRQAGASPRENELHEATPQLRVGFTASRKVGSAVARNRARRRLRAVVDRVMPEHAAPDHDYVVIARAGTLTRPFDKLVDDLESALRHVNAYRSRVGCGGVARGGAVEPAP